MRLYLGSLVCMIGLAGCVNYADMHNNATPLTAEQLARPIQRHITATSANLGWWTQFHDEHLNSIIMTALANSPTMQMAEMHIRKAQAMSQGAAAALWPSVDLSGALTRERFSNEGLAPPPFNGATLNIGEVGFNFNYELDFWGKNRELLAANISEETAAKADLAEANLLIAGATANAYFHLQSDIYQQKIAVALLRLRNEELAIMTNRSQHGLNSDIPVKTALANLQSATVLLSRYQQDEALHRHQLAELTGQNSLIARFEITPFSYTRYQLALPNSLPAHLLANRPDVYASRLRTETAAHQVNVSKARFFPDINLTALFSYQSIVLGQLFHQSNQNNFLTGAIDLPIFDAGARRADLSSKFADYDLAVTTYNQTILTALQEIADQLSILHTLRAQLLAENTAVHATEKNYRLTAIQYHRGIVDYTQVLESKGTFLQQQSIQINYQTQKLQAIVAMIDALGGYYFQTGKNI